MLREFRGSPGHAETVAGIQGTDMMKSFVRVLLAVVGATWLILPSANAATACGTSGVWLQVLGSGGPEMTDRRASSGYLVWRDGHARVLIDMGGGSMLRFEQSGARIEDLQAILLTHLHVDHSADLPVLIKAAFFSDRTSDLPLYGPTGGGLFPDTSDFVQSLFGEKDGAFRYLSGFTTGDAAFRLVAHDVAAHGRDSVAVVDDKRFRLTAVPVHHGSVPALAWRVDIAGRRIAIGGDMNGDYHTLEKLASGVDLLVAHNAVPEGARGVERNLHMPPSLIGEIAATAKVKYLVLSHRMNRTLGREAESERYIRQRYGGPMIFADDGDCFSAVRPTK
jgi:ribonuclease BN (tRNA processing enzyme)